MSLLYMTDSTTSMVVDFSGSTCNGVSITRSGNNPMILISIPTQKEDPKFWAGAIAINLLMLSQTIEIRFTLLDGVGSHYMSANPGDMANKTNYEKLWWMFVHDADNKYLSWNGFVFEVQIKNLTTPTGAGEKDLMQNCSMSLAVLDTWQ